MAGDQAKGKAKAKAKAQSARSASPAPPRRAPGTAAEDKPDGDDPALQKNGEKQAKKQSTGLAIVSKGTNVAVTLIMMYACVVANSFRGILWPTFPEMDPNTHQYIAKHNNIIRAGDLLKGKVWVDKTAWPPKKPPLAEFEFRYKWDDFEEVSRQVNATITNQQLGKGQNMLLSAEVLHEASGKRVLAKGGLVKPIKLPELRIKYQLLSQEVCPEVEEPAWGKQGNQPAQIARGIPKMQVRLVFDETAYPHPWAQGPYLPQLFVDEFWLTNDQLVKLNTTGANMWDTEIQFSLMGVARWRFQRHMEMSLQQNAKLFGDDSEEMLQMRDLFANTNPYLLTATLIVSVLHMVFEFLAFKNDVQFWQGCDLEALSKYVSVQSIVVGIFMQILLLMYLWDESANFLVLITSLVGILIDVWKVQRAMRFSWTKLFGFLPVPTLVSKVTKEKADDFDAIAMKWLGIMLAPLIAVYAFYSVMFECHRGWYSYFLFVSSSCVYSLGFILMTPQVFINYKHKTVAFLPWRKFVYRAISTFIDDLFAFIIRMPTMHRVACFRDDIVFLIYLYQRWLYPVDKSRTFDEDGYELSPQEVDGGHTEVAESTETKKSK